MIRSALAILLLAASASAAPPPGWKLDETMSADLTRKAQRGSYFGGTPTTKISVDAFIAPEGGSLFVTRAEATPTAELRDGVATRALFELVQSARRTGSVEIETTSQRADAAAKMFEATLTWRDPKAGFRQVGRTLVVADKDHLVAVTGECLLPAAAPQTLEPPCLASLAALDPGIALDQRVALTMVGAPAETTEPPIPTAPTPERTAPTPEPTAPTRITEQPRLGDPGRNSLAPMTIAPAKREVDRRPIYLGGGIVVLAALFWWNRRRRDRFDREDEPHSATAEPSSGDDDADDLQAAARGAAPKDES